MKSNKFLRSIIWYGITFLVGLGLFIYSLTMKTDDNMFATMGMTLMIIMGLRLFECRKLSRDEEAMKKYVQKNTEERTVYIANKSRSLMFALSVYAQFIVGIVLYFMHYEMFATGLFYVTAAQICAYLFIYMYYNKKY